MIGQATAAQITDHSISQTKFKPVNSYQETVF